MAGAHETMIDESRLSGALHKVYYLLDAETHQLLYVGRSPNPQERLYRFRAVHHREVILGICQRFKDFKEAQEAERSAIKRHAPPYNRKVMSATGMLGKTQSPETREKIRHSLTGGKRSPEMRARVSAYRKGRPTNTGKKWSPEVRARMSAAAKLREEKKRNERL